MRNVLILLLVAYLLAFVAVRMVWSETWDKDQQVYVMFPGDQGWVYYLFRPLASVDGALTGRRFHLGPH